MSITYRQNMVTKTITVTPSQLLERGYLALSAAEFLSIKSSHERIKNKVGVVTSAGLTGALGVSSVDALIVSLDLIYAGSILSNLQGAATLAEKGGAAILNVFSAADERGSKSITMTLSYVDVYDTNTGVVLLKIPRAVSGVVYN